MTAISTHLKCTRSLHSSNTSLLSVPRVHTTFASCSFSVAPPSVRNSLSLPTDIHACSSSHTFRHCLKTHRFKQAPPSGSHKCLRFGLLVDTVHHKWFHLLYIYFTLHDSYWHLLSNEFLGAVVGQNAGVIVTLWYNRCVKGRRLNVIVTLLCWIKCTYNVQHIQLL